MLYISLAIFQTNPQKPPQIIENTSITKGFSKIIDMANPPMKLTPKQKIVDNNLIIFISLMILFN